MASGVRQTGGSIRDIKRSLAALPTSVTHSVAQRGAPVLTELAGGAYDSNRNVYGDTRRPGVKGNTLSLERTGATRRTVKFVSNGTIIRCVLGTKYAKFLIGKYGILPNGAMPADWSAALAKVVKETRARQS
jgi:hypothetical protein